MRSLLFSSGISFFSSYVLYDNHENVRSAISYANVDRDLHYSTAMHTVTVTASVYSPSLTRTRAVPHIHTDAKSSSPYAHTRSYAMLMSRMLLRSEELSLTVSSLFVRSLCTFRKKLAQEVGRREQPPDHAARGKNSA